MLSLSIFLTKILEISDEQPTYSLGHDASDGSCDCIGLIIGAIRRVGGAWSGVHGSNWAARNEVTDLHPIPSTASLKKGDLVFKCHPPGESGWNLPSRYASHPDQNDYYHVGVVTSTDPLRITHMTTPTIKTDTKLGKWSYSACLKCISDTPKKGVLPMTATVISPDGNPVKLRPTPSTEKPWLEKIPVHTVVTVLEQGSPWSKIAFRDLTGYMKSEFLQTADPDAVPESDPASVSSGVDYETAFHQLAALAAQMMDIIEQNGVG